MSDTPIYFSLRAGHAEETGASIHDRYWRLWNEITREVIITPGERYRIRERINALNALGFSVAELELNATERGDQLRLQVFMRSSYSNT